MRDLTGREHGRRGLPTGCSEAEAATGPQPEWGEISPRRLPEGRDCVIFALSVDGRLLHCPRKGSAGVRPRRAFFYRPNRFVNGPDPAKTAATRRRSILRSRFAALVVLTLVAVGADRLPRPAGGTVLVRGLVLDRERGELRIEARVATDRGFLEQLVCLAGTREHESLLSISVPPSLVHAGLLALGLEPGRPGRWTARSDGRVSAEPPSGPGIEAFVRRVRGGRVTEVPLRSWTVAPDGSAFEASLVFAGSQVLPNPPSLARIRGPGEHYVADLTGSAVGLVTFGDEMIAPLEVRPDRADLSEPIWQARTERMPAPGTAVTLILRPVAIGRGSVP